MIFLICLAGGAFTSITLAILKLAGVAGLTWLAVAMPFLIGYTFFFLWLICELAWHIMSQLFIEKRRDHVEHLHNR